MRAKFQGLRNVVVFNWPYYAVALTAGIGFSIGSLVAPPPASLICVVGLALVMLPTLSSLFVSLWVYDFSDLYGLPWLTHLDPRQVRRVLVINAGFDEISSTIKERLPTATIVTIDFYDKAAHPAASIKRARAAQVLNSKSVEFEGTERPFEADRTDLAVAFMSAHEIRDREERIALFRKTVNCLRPDGTVIVVEHLRDLANFIAYNIGFRHFLAREEWLKTFAGAGLEIRRESCQTPFVTTFVLQRACAKP
jgi:SAM-dependent methyltransferase